MGEEADSEVHGAADDDIDFLVGFLEVEVVDVEGALHAAVVNQAIDFWVVFCDFFNEGGDGGDVAGVEGVLWC